MRRKYRVEKMTRSPFHHLYERRYVKGKGQQWVCIGILTGINNSRKIEEKLNG